MLTSVLNSFPIVVVTLLCADVFACVAHRVCSPTSAADPLEGFDKTRRRVQSQAWHRLSVPSSDQRQEQQTVFKFECYVFTYGLHCLS